jgi:hypothetical protein
MQLQTTGSVKAPGIGDPALNAGLPGQGWACGRVGWDDDTGHASHADHGDGLTHRRSQGRAGGRRVTGPARRALT